MILSGGDFESIEVCAYQPFHNTVIILHPFFVQASYYTLVEVDIFVRIANGFYAKSLDSIRVEGESGIVQATSAPVPQNSDPSLFPQFSGQGYASLNYSQSEIVIVQWAFPTLPTSSEYQFSFRYSSHDHRNRRRSVNIMQGGRNFDARVTFLANCFSCTAYLTSSDANQVTQRANYTLEQSLVLITVTFSSVDISLDTIVATPLQFYNPVSLDDATRFLSLCAVNSAPLM